MSQGNQMAGFVEFTSYFQLPVEAVYVSQQYHRTLGLHSLKKMFKELKNEINT